MKKLITLLFLLFSLFSKAQTYITKDTTFQSKLARISYVSGYTDSTRIFIFVHGLGEVGTGTNNSQVYGPHYWFNNGKVPADFVSLGDGTRYPVFVTLQLASGFPNPSTMKAAIDDIFSRFKVKYKCAAVFGLSRGAGFWNDFFAYKPTSGDYSYANRFSSIVNLCGMFPDDTYGAAVNTYPAKFGQSAKNSTLSYLGIEQYLDGRDISTLIDNIQDSIGVGTGRTAFFWTNFGAGGHTNFNDMYNPTQRNWTLSNADVQNSNGGALNTIPITTGQNLYEWSYRKMRDTTNTVAGALLVNAGTDQDVQLPTTTAYLTGNVSGGTSPYTYSWTKISGSGTQSIIGNTTLTPTITGLVSGTYVFRLSSTDATPQTVVDDIQITMLPACNEAAPITYTQTATSPGEIYITNAKGTKPWKGGDTVIIPAGTYSVVHIDSLRGDICRPLVIKLSPGVIATTAIRFNHAWFVNISGYDASQPAKHYCGAQAKAVSLVRVTNVIFDAVEIGPNIDGVGIYCKQDVDTADANTWRSSGFVMKNIKLRRLWVHDIHGEGFYFGHTSYDGDDYHVPANGMKIPAILLDSAEVSDCYVENTGWDGIQVSGAQNGCLIFNNTVKNFGLLDLPGQRAGILSGGGTNSKVYNNTIQKGNGNGIQVFGYGLCEIYNNTIDSTGLTQGDWDATHSIWKGEQSIYMDDRPSTSITVPGLSVSVHDNYIHHTSTYATGTPWASGAVSIPNGNGTMTAANFYNNTFCIPGATTGWEAKYIKLAAGFTQSGNILSCPAALPIFRSLKKFKQL